MNTIDNKLDKKTILEILQFLGVYFNHKEIKEEVMHKISYTFKEDFVNNYLPPVKVTDEFFLNILKGNKEIFDRVNTYGIEVNSDVENENYVIIYSAKTLNDVLDILNEEKKEIEIEKEYIDEFEDDVLELDRERKYIQIADEYINEYIKEDEYINELDLYLGHIEWTDEKNNKSLFAFNTNIFKCDFLSDKLIFAFNGELFVSFKK